MKNILILNAGTRNKLISYFKKEAEGKCQIIATDSYDLAPALYEADKYYVTSRWDEPGYWDEIMAICQEDQVGMICSLIDPELQYLARHKGKLEEKGILVNISAARVIEECFDKYATIEFIKRLGMPAIKTYRMEDIFSGKDRDRQMDLPLFVKPRYGSGSAGIQKIDRYEQLKMFGEVEDEYIVQEYMEAQEIGADVYVDLISRQVVSIFTKKKLKMRSGETDKSVSFKDERLFDLIKLFAEERGLLGANDIDVFLRDGEYYISEVNPRFGGGYLHAYECGVNFPKMLFNNMNGIVNEPQIGEYRENVYMMKYFDVCIQTFDENKRVVR